MNGNKHQEDPLVSVIINCYNGQDFLREAIDSIFSQTYCNWEIIFWDNLSSDESARIARSYGPKVRYFCALERTPLGEARTLAMAKAKGEYFSFIDCDDIWLPTKLATQVELMEANPEFSLCYAGIEEIYPDGGHFRNVPAVYRSGYLLGELLLQYDVNILTLMLRAVFLKESGLVFDKNITASEEYCLVMQAASKYRIGVIPLILAKYRVHPLSLTSKSVEILGTQRRYTLNKIIRENPGIEIKFKSEFKEAFARSNYYDARWHMSNGEHIMAFKKMARYCNLSLRYMLISALTLLPVRIWNKVHLRYRSRV